jgi:cephalosporin-C deacetylase-like acetyl esterase
MASQPGWSAGGSLSLYSAAAIMEKAQKTWSSFPSFLDWFEGICEG